MEGVILLLGIKLYSPSVMVATTQPLDAMPCTPTAMEDTTLLLAITRLTHSPAQITTLPLALKHWRKPLLLVTTHALDIGLGIT